MRPVAAAPRISILQAELKNLLCNFYGIQTSKYYIICLKLMTRPDRSFCARLQAQLGLKKPKLGWDVHCEIRIDEIFRVVAKESYSGCWLNCLSVLAGTFLSTQLNLLRLCLFVFG